MNIGLGIGTRYPKFNQLSLALKAISAIRRNGGTLIGIPDNFAGAYIESDGTKPVTAVGDVLGLLTDRSYGAGNLGPEKVANGDFSAGTTGWAFPSGWALVSGAAAATSASSSLLQSGAPLVAGKSYQVGFDWTHTSGTLYVRVGAGTAITHTTSGRKSMVLVAATTAGIEFYGGAVSGSLDNITVREVLGNHATQPTTASKPTVTRVPKRLGPELSAYASGFASTTGISGVGATVAVSANELVITSTSADGSDRGEIPISGLAVGRSYSATIVVRRGAQGTDQQIQQWTVGTIPTTVISSTTSTAYPVAFVATAASGVARIYSQAVSGAVGDAAIVTSISVREVLEWTNAISFDGSNDFLQTGITTGNEGWICAGVTPANTTTAMSVANAGEGTSTIPGVWLFANSGNWYSSAADGSLRTQNALPMVGTSAQVISMGWNATTLTLGVNTTEVSTPKIGSGSWASGANVLRFGLYNGSSTPFNGPMTAQVICPVLPTEADRSLIRKWIGSLQGQSL